MELTRGLHPDTLAAFANPPFYPILLLESVWPDGVVRMSSSGEMTWNGETWKPFGDIAEVEMTGEAAGAIPARGSIKVLGALEKVLDYADPAARGGLVRMWIGAVTEPGGTEVIGDLFAAFTGYLDANDLNFTAANPAIGAAEQVSLSLAAETGPPARAHATITHSDEDQKFRHPGDTLFERCAAAARWRALPLQFPDPG